MRVLYYSAATTGSGHVVQGLSIAAGLRRQGIKADYSMLCAPGPFSSLADSLGVTVGEMPLESEEALGPDGWQDSQLFRSILALAPDILLVDITWFCLDSMIHALPGKKVYLTRQIDPRYFAIRVGGREIRFRPGDWNVVARTEPGFELPFPAEEFNPIVIRSRAELLTAEVARKELGIEDGERAALFAFNGKEGEGAAAWKSFSYLEDEGWRVIRSHNRERGLFPAMDYFNAFDLLICGAGYSAFWEARSLEKEAFFVPFARTFEDQGRRVALFSDYVPKANGADELALRIAAL